MVPMRAHTRHLSLLQRIHARIRGLASVPFFGLLLVGLLAGCGSGSGGGETSPSSPSTTVTQTVGSAGGTVSLPDGAVVTFDAGVLKDGTQLTVSSSPTNQTSVPTGVTALSRTITVEFPAGSLSNAQGNNTGSVTIEIPRQASAPASAMLQFLAPNEAVAQSFLTSDPYNIIKIDLQTHTAGSTPMFYRDSGGLTALVKVAINKLSDTVKATTTRIQAAILNVNGCYPSKMELYQFNNQNKTFTKTIAPESGKTPLILVHGIQEPFISPVLLGLSCKDPFRSTWSGLAPIYPEYPEKFVDLFVKDPELPLKFQLFSINYNTLDPIYQVSGPALAQLLKGTFNQTPVVVLAHSMGGLVTRSAMKQAAMDTVGARIDGLVTLATPHRGTPVASQELFDILRTSGLGIGIIDFWVTAGLVNSGGGQGFRDLAWDNFDGRGLHGIGGQLSNPGGIGNSDLDTLRLSEAESNRANRIFALAGKDPSDWLARLVGFVIPLSEFGYPINDSVVPESSARFQGVSVMGPETFPGVSHFSILEMSEHPEIFAAAKSALLGFLQAPPPPPPPSTSVNVTGIWQGTHTDNFVPTAQPIILNLTQTGTNVTGSWTSQLAGNGGDTASGTFTGNFTSGSIMTFVANQTSPVSCPGSFTGTATVNGNSMSATYSGNDCRGPISNGQVSVTKLAAPSSSTFTLAVSKPGIGTGTVTSSIGGINCGTVCISQPINGGDFVVLTATPGNGSTFGGWSGGGCNGLGPCTVTMTANQNVMATFNLLPPGYIVQGGLTWMPATFLLNWANANAYCTNTTINGQTGWRLPTRAELESLSSSYGPIGGFNNQSWTERYIWSSTPESMGHYFTDILVGFGWGVWDVNPFGVTCVHN